MIQVFDKYGKLEIEFTGGGGGGVQYTSGETTPANPIGTIPVFDDGGIIKSVSNTNPLPVSASIDTSGLATEAKQNTEISILNAINVLLAAGIDVSIQNSSIAITAASLPLPTGAATQTTLAAINTLLASGISVTITGSVAATIADGADVTEGAIADAIAAAGGVGTISAKLRRTTQGLEDLKTLIVLAAGSNIIGKVGIDQTTPGTTNKVDTGLVQALTDAQLRASAVPVIQAAPTTPINGRTTVTTAGTRVVLAGSTTVKSVTIKALGTNTGIIYVGDSAVSSSNGFPLYARDTVSMDISNLNVIYIDSSVNNEGISYIAVN